MGVLLGKLESRLAKLEAKRLIGGQTVNIYNLANSAVGADQFLTLNNSDEQVYLID